MLSLVGAINVPIIYFSVKWWNTLHQGSSVSMTAAPKMATIMLTGMLIMSFAAWFYAIAVSLHRVRSIIVERVRRAGAIVIGKTNTPEFGLGSQSYNPVHGVTRNAMGGYAFYVWGAYGVTALVIVVEILAVRARRRGALEEARLAGPDEPAPTVISGGTR